MQRTLLIAALAAGFLLADSAPTFAGKGDRGRGHGRGGPPRAGQHWNGGGPPPWAPAWGYRARHHDHDWIDGRRDDDDDWSDRDRYRPDPHYGRWNDYGAWNGYPDMTAQPFGPWHQWQWYYPSHSFPPAGTGWNNGYPPPGYYGGPWGY